MNHKVSFLSALCLCMAAVVVSWTTWFSLVSAQETVPIPGSEASQRPVGEATALPPLFTPNQQPSAQYLPGPGVAPPIRLPAGATQYYSPNTLYHAPGYPTSRYSVTVSATDPQSSEAIMAYQNLQNQISELLQRRTDPKDDAERGSLRKQLVDATAAQFDLQQQQRKRQIEELKKRLEAVETSFANRDKLKDEIVEKRVADILREPDQLQWESLSIATAPNGATFLPPPLAPSQTTAAAPLGPIVHQFSGKNYMLRTATRVQRETIVNEDGTESIVEKPVQETEYVEVEPTAIVPIPNDTPPGARSATPSDATRAFTNSQRQPSPAGLSVAEAKARVRLAELKREQMLRRTGNDSDDDVKTLTAELDLARVMLAQAQDEFEGRTKLLELDLRQAESVCEQAIADLARTQSLNRRAPNTISSTQISKQEAVVEQARIDLERAKTLLDIHQKSNAPQSEQPKVAR